jgi:pimeloyl-ACP methyl ester carboxylesterase
MSDPTIVLVHGAFTDASSWRRLYSELNRDGFTVKAPPNQLQSVQSDAEYLQAVVSQIDGPVLLVGHSYGGAVITAAGLAHNVAGLVYVAAFAPDEGEDLGSLQAKFAAAPAGEYFRPSAIPGGGTEFSIDPAGFHEVFAADLSAEEAGFMANAQRPLSGAAFGEPAKTPAWRSKPSWAIVPTADKAINPDLHRFSFERMGATVTEVQGASHVVMLSQPGAVARVVGDAARNLVAVA